MLAFSSTMATDAPRKELRARALGLGLEPLASASTSRASAGARSGRQRKSLFGMQRNNWRHAAALSTRFRPRMSAQPGSKKLLELLTSKESWLHVGTAIGTATVAAVVAVVPAALRMSGAAEVPQAWAALSGIALVPMILAVLILRQTRVGLRAFSGPEAPARAVGLVGFCVTMFVVFTVLGNKLAPPHTHHMALAGATFALVSLVVAIVMALVFTRLVGVINGLGEGARRVVLVGSGVVLAAAIAYLGYRTTRGMTADGAPAGAAGAMLVDALAFGITAVFASRDPFLNRKLFAYAGPPLAVGLLVLGVILLHGIRHTR